MGKKNRKSSENETGMSNRLKREILEICNSLLERCKVPFKNEWEEFLELYRMLEKLQKKQENLTLKHENRQEHLKEFISWLNQNGVECPNIEIDSFEDEGLGLKAKAPIKESDLIISIPKKLMLLSNSGINPVLDRLVKEDCILKVMPNIVLSLHLLCEYNNIEKSFWSPYLKILPANYNTPLFGSLEDLYMLKGSPTLSDVIGQFRNVARQYAYFFKLFQSLNGANKVPIGNFCYQDYRWAVSTVMTRQNKIPSADGASASCQHSECTHENKEDAALIPFWDLCNHQKGHITTEYDVETESCRCYAMADVQVDQQISIFYGPRSNSEFFINNGFVPRENKHNCVPIKLGVSKNDSLYAVKAEVMARCKINTTAIFYLSCFEQQPVESDMIAFLRLFSMSLESLMELMGGPDVEKKRGWLRLVHEWQDDASELKVWSYLHTRCSLLLKLYATSQKEDEVLLKNTKESGGLSSVGRCVVQLRASEKSILQKVIDYCNERTAAIKKSVESTPIPSSFGAAPVLAQ